MGTVVPFTRKLGWIADLDLEGQGLRDTATILAKLAKRSDISSYGALRRILEKELASLRRQRATGFVTALWRQHRLDLLPRLIAACDRRGDYLSLRGVDLLQDAACSSRALAAALELTRDTEIEKRLKKAY
jgi:hypothetical protein